MKNQFLKIFLAIMTTTLFVTGCSSDNNTPNDDNDTSTQIEGIWKPIQVIFIDNNGATTTDNLTTCEQTGRTTFSSNGNFAQIGYYPISGNCEIEFDNTGSWQIINNNTLKVTLNGQVDNGTIGDYLITELTATTLKIDADTDPNSIDQEVYVFERVN